MARRSHSLPALAGLLAVGLALSCFRDATSLGGPCESDADCDEGQFCDTSSECARLSGPGPGSAETGTTATDSTGGPPAAESGESGKESDSCDGAEGSLSCPCDGGSCELGLECQAGTCVKDPCPDGELGCECISETFCDGSLECISGICIDNSGPECIEPLDSCHDNAVGPLGECCPGTTCIGFEADNVWECSAFCTLHSECATACCVDIRFVGTACQPSTMGCPSLCIDTCKYAFDKECDDGGPGADYSLCELGTDCSDCGPRDPKSKMAVGPEDELVVLPSSKDKPGWALPTTLRSVHAYPTVASSLASGLQSGDPVEILGGLRDSFHSGSGRGPRYSRFGAISIADEVRFVDIGPTDSTPAPLALGCMGGFIEAVRVLAVPSVGLDEILAVPSECPLRESGALYCDEEAHAGLHALENLRGHLAGWRLSLHELSDAATLSSIFAPSALPYFASASHVSSRRAGRWWHHMMVIVADEQSTEAGPLVFDVTGYRGVSLRRVSWRTLARYFGATLADSGWDRYVPVSGRIAVLASPNTDIHAG